jgi:hypothetical protein
LERFLLASSSKSKRASVYQEWTKLFIERDLSIACYCNGSSSDIPHYIAKGVAPDENSSN